MFFESWQAILKIIISTVFVYFFLMIVCHVITRRCLAKMNSFDWIITFTIGSVAGSAIIRNDVVILEILSALSSLLLLHYLKYWLSARFNVANGQLKGSPCVLYYQGRFICQAMKKNGISQLDIEARVRSAGYADLCQVSAVIFEPGGHLSVITAGQVNDALVAKLTPGTQH